VVDTPRQLEDGVESALINVDWSALTDNFGWEIIAPETRMDPSIKMLLVYSNHRAIITRTIQIVLYLYKYS
jgi:hypothetical protein